MILSPRASTLNVPSVYTDPFQNPSTQVLIDVTPSSPNLFADLDKIVSVQDLRHIRPFLSPTVSRFNVEKEQYAPDAVQSVDNDGEIKKSALLPRPLIAVKDFVFAHVSPKTICILLDVRELLWPLTWKKHAVFAAVGALIAAIFLCKVRFHWIQSAISMQLFT